MSHLTDISWSKFPKFWRDPKINRFFKKPHAGPYHKQGLSVYSITSSF